MLTIGGIIAIAICGFIVLLFILQCTRVNYLRSKRKRYIKSLDPVKNESEIVRLTWLYDLPYEVQQGHLLAGIAGFIPPGAAKTIHGTGEALNRTFRRADDTLIVMYGIWMDGFESELSKAMLKKLVYIHAFYRKSMTNQEMMWIIMDSCIGCVECVEKFGWRQLYKNEIIAWWNVWKAIGQRLGVKDMPITMEEGRKLHKEIMETFTKTPQHEELLTAILKVKESLLPKALKKYFLQLIALFGNKKMLEFLNIPPVPPLWIRFVYNTLFKVRKLLYYTLITPKTKPYNPYVEGPDPLSYRGWLSYPDGFKPEEAGVDPGKKKQAQRNKEKAAQEQAAQEKASQEKAVQEQTVTTQEKEIPVQLPGKESIAPQEKDPIAVQVELVSKSENQNN